MRQTIGLIGGGFKPFTKGHYHLVEKAAGECDEVILFVSTGDRKRKGEVPITWNQMNPVWEKFLKKAMPANVKVVFHFQPIKGIIDTLIEANDDVVAEPRNNNTYIIYSDPEDMAGNFSQKTQLKYFPRLFKNHQVIFKPIERASGVNISGTQMRNFLATGNVKAFIEGLPKPVQVYGPDIFKMLGGTTLDLEP